MIGNVSQSTSPLDVEVDVQFSTPSDNQRSTQQVNSLGVKYSEEGYFVLRNYFSADELTSLRDVVLKFHDLWKQDNKKFYQEEAFNSSLITGSQYLAVKDRLKLFNFIGSEKIMYLVNSVIANNPAFMNTQLFFNPVTPTQKDFWHRDCQYDHEVEYKKR